MHAVVFSGGGAKGIYQAYELTKQLEEGLPPPDTVYGTSVGAINAAGYAYQGTRLLDLWQSIRGKSDVLSRNWLLWNATGMYNSKPLKRLLEKYIDGTPICRAVVCSVDLISQELSYVSNTQVSLETFREAVRASAAIPMAISPVGTRVDGAVREVTPLYRAIEDGVDTITVFLCNPYEPQRVTKVWKPPGRFFPALGIGIRAIDIMEHEIFINDIEKCLFYNGIPGKKQINLRVFCPRRKDMFIHTLDFDPIKIRSVIYENIRMENALYKAEDHVLKKVA